MKFNPNKYEVMYFGKSSTSRTYTVNGTVLKNVGEWRRLGVQVYSRLKVLSMVDREVHGLKVHGLLPFINWDIGSRSWNFYDTTLLNTG